MASTRIWLKGNQQDVVLKLKETSVIGYSGKFLIDRPTGRTYMELHVSPLDVADQIPKLPDDMIECFTYKDEVPKRPNRKDGLYKFDGRPIELTLRTVQKKGPSFPGGCTGPNTYNVQQISASAPSWSTLKNILMLFMDTSKPFEPTVPFES